MRKSQTQKILNKINNIVCGTLAVASFIIMVSECEDLTYWYVPFLAMLALPIIFVFHTGLDVIINGR